ncbi:MAG TPA: septal ring lytic transglycosylase RlpA family protein [Steroidobacteraceae bacterium]|nr:septal ring lytic transglycosylase RlpA family protein [Steroidobacteraceae bacterium]
MTQLRATGTALFLLAIAGCAREPVRPAPPPAPTTPPAGAGVPRDEPRAKSGNPPFYEVGGHRYVVLPTAVGYVEQGIASWYGPDFHGGRTATGETYDMNAMTGAHPTLPLPTWARVTNLENGRSVVVRLNDRGPFAKGRIIDLSRAAAEQLDMIRMGTARVEVRSLTGTDALVAAAPAGQSTPAPAVLVQVSNEPAPDSATGAAPVVAGPAYYAQAGAFASRANAELLAERLRGAGIAGVSVIESTVDGRTLFRVRAGPVSGFPEFDALIERMRAAGADGARLAL